jgi:hypothetical protein
LLHECILPHIVACLKHHHQWVVAHRTDWIAGVAVVERQKQRLGGASEDFSLLNSAFYENDVDVGGKWDALAVVEVGQIILTTLTDQLME